MPVTIVDVAEAAGVSKTTASDALRGRGRVSDATRQAVVSAATALGYTLNRSARHLRTATTGAIGLYLPQVLVRSDYYLSFVYGAMSEAAAFGYDVTLIFAGQQSPDRYAPHVDGIVLCDARENDPMIDRLLSTRLPTVSSEPIRGDDRAAGVIWSDARRLARELLDELAAAGACAPALLGTTTASDWACTIHDAYGQWCAERGIQPLSALADFGAETAALQRIVGTLLDSRPRIDALVCVSDGVALRVAPSLTARGLELGTGFLLASCSEREAVAPLHVAINTDGGRAGRECARLLFELIAGDAEPGTRREMRLEVLTAASSAVSSTP